MRRRNKSHKVPNVKLRPAPALTPHARARDLDASYDRSSDSEMPFDPSMVDLCPRPFKGFAICATGTMDKSTVFKMAFELGAGSTSDFTDRVTHLIANSHGGAKYSCALERRIPIMTPDWITEAHAIWLRGDDVDVEQSIAKHRLPIFSGVVLSLSGIDDVHRRTDINRLVTTHQGIYLKNLERPVKVTHLLCSGDTETDKMKYAEKFNKRKEAHIHIVWEEWFWDCLEFGGRFDEKKYQVSRPRPERKSLHENPMPPLPTQTFAPCSHPNSTIHTNSINQPKQLRPVVPTGSFAVIDNIAADGEEEEIANVNKPVPAVTLQLWQSLLKPRGFELEGGKLVRSPSKSQAARSPPSTPARRHVQSNALNYNGTGVQHGKEKEKESVISSFRRTNSFAPVLVKEPAVRQPFRRNTTCSSVRPGEAGGSKSHDLVQPEGESTVLTLFAGYTFRLLGEARCQSVRSAIENGGGVVTDDDADEPSFIVVRLISGSKLYHDEFDNYARTKYRTECWLEHCVFHERICKPDENVSFIPLRTAMPAPGTEKINLSLSGLDQSELCWIRRLARAVGITLEPAFCRRSTHLLCPGGIGAKFDKALEWRIPVVSLAWLEDIARTGTIPRVDEYLVGGSHMRVSVDGGEGSTSAQRGDLVPGVGRGKGKGKEKETEVEHQMMDITNDGSPNQPLFVKNTALLRDASSQNRGLNARQHRDEIVGPASPALNGLFGKARFLTHDSDPPEEVRLQVKLSAMSSSPAIPPPQSSSPPLPEPEQPPAPTPPTLASVVPLYATPVRQPASLKRGADADAQAQARIPSSRSPSPMKLLPSSSLPCTLSGSSPSACLPDTDAITKALHKSLTSLLGKRPVAEEDEAAMRDPAGAGGVGGAKKGKRVRPGGPSNILSRNASRENADVHSPHRPIICQPILPPPLPQPDLDMSFVDELEMDEFRSADESTRVMYEDPAQAEEKRRLLRMVGEVEVGAAEVEVVAGTRRPMSRTRRMKRTKISGL